MKVHYVVKDSACKQLKVAGELIFTLDSSRSWEISSADFDDEDNPITEITVTLKKRYKI